jgi:hypothetical protein
VTDVEQPIADKLLNIRMTQPQKARVEAHARQESLAASTWAREALLMLTAGELSLRDVEVAVQEARSRRTAPAEPEPPRTLVRGAGSGLGRQEFLDGRCLHPVHLREKLPFYDQCRCGQKFRR